MKKIIGLLLVLTTISTMLIGCSSKESGNNEVSKQEQKKEEVKKEENKSLKEGDVIYDDDKVKITYLSSKLDNPENGGYCWYFEIQNKTKNYLHVEYKNEQANSHIVGMGIEEQLDSQETKEYTVRLSDNNARMIGIEKLEDIKSLEFDFVITVNDDWIVYEDVNITKEMVLIADENEPSKLIGYTNKDGDTVVLDDDNVKVICGKLEYREDYASSAKMEIYVLNKTNQDIILSLSSSLGPNILSGYVNTNNIRVSANEDLCGEVEVLFDRDVFDVTAGVYIETSILDKKTSNEITASEPVSLPIVLKVTE